jgi:hypothetical protein
VSNVWQPYQHKAREASCVEILVPVEHSERATPVIGVRPCTTVRGFAGTYEGRTACYSVMRSRAMTAAQAAATSIGHSVWVYLGGHGSHEVRP